MPKVLAVVLVLTASKVFMTFAAQEVITLV